MSRMYIRKTSWKQDQRKDRHDLRSKHNQWKSKLVSVNRGGGVSGLSVPLIGVLGGRAPPKKIFRF